MSELADEEPNTQMKRTKKVSLFSFVRMEQKQVLRAQSKLIAESENYGSNQYRKQIPKKKLGYTKRVEPGDQAE